MEEKSIFKKVSSLIGGIATHAISVSILYYYTFLPYRFSYLKRLNTDLKSISLSYIIPVSFMFMYGFSWLGAFLERKINARVPLFVGNFCVVTAAGLLWLSKSSIIDYILFSVYGIGIGINNLACMRNVFYFFPKVQKQGLMLGISMGGYILAAGLPIMVNMMINPEGVRPSINFDGEGEFIYPVYITRRINFFILMYIGVVAVLSLISILCLCNYETVMPEVDNCTLLCKSTISDLPTNSLNKSVKPLSQFDFKSIFKKCQLYNLILISILSTYGTFVCLFTYYEFGKYHFADSIMLTYCPLGFILSCGLGRLLFGLSYDKLRFKMNMYINLGFQIFLCILFNFSVKWSWMYLVILSCFGFTFGGISVSFSTYIPQLYGREIGFEVYGIISYGKALSSIFSIAMVSILGTINVSFPISCLTMYIAGAVCNLVCILFIIFPIDDLQIV